VLGNSEATDPETDTKRIAQLLKHGAHGLAAPEAAVQEEAFQSENIEEVRRGGKRKTEQGCREEEDGL
jgi:hypothetical protein